MDRTQFKQRIVGAIVLVALGVIFIPMILDRERDDSPITGSNIPEKPKQLRELAGQTPPPFPARPDIDTNKPQIADEYTPPVEQTDSSTPTKSVEKATTKAQTTVSKSVEDKTEKPKPAATGKTRAWVVQVASFAERNKALKLRDRLRKAKYPTFVESIKSTKGTRYRVRVGPVVQRSKAEDMKKKIVKKFRLKDALVMSHP